MPIGAAISAVATVGSAAIQANAANKAAKQQAKGAAQARQDMLPFALPGQGAMASLASLYGIDPATGEVTGEAMNPAALDAFRRSPDYQFALTEGLRGVETSNAGRGMLRSGNTLRDLTSFGQGLATQTFGNFKGSLAQLAQIGAGAAAGAGQAAMQQGTALASGTVGAANAWGGALGNIGNTFMLQSLLKPSQSAYQLPNASYTLGNPSGFTAPSAPIGTGIWPV